MLVKIKYYTIHEKFDKNEKYLTKLQIYLKNYVLDNAMQDWCQKCAFRLKTSAESPFKDIKEEEKEFNSAVVSV